jgi:hypothetical protein
LEVVAEKPKENTIGEYLWETLWGPFGDYRAHYRIALVDDEADKLLTTVARNGANRIEDRYGDVKVLDGLMRDAELQLVLPECVRLLQEVRRTGTCCCRDYRGSYARVMMRTKPTAGPAGGGHNNGSGANAGSSNGGSGGGKPLIESVYGAAVANLTPGEALSQEPAPGPGDGGEDATVDQVIAYQIGEGVSRVEPVVEDISVAFGMGAEGKDQPRGVIVGNAVLPVRLPANGLKNALAAIKKRTEKVPQKPKIPQMTHRSLIAIERFLCENIFTAESVDRFFEKHVSVEDVKSSKWTHTRFLNAINNVLSTAKICL